MDQNQQDNVSSDDSDSLELWAWLCFTFLLGVLLIYSAHELIHTSPYNEICRDLGIAFCISVVVAGFVELSLSRRIFLSGLDAIIKRTVPPEVWEEFRQHVISQTMMRKDWTLTMKIAADETGRYFSTTCVTYTIVSLKDTLKEQVVHRVDLPRTLEGDNIRYTGAMIGQNRYNSYDELKSKNLLPDDLTLSFPVELAKNKDELDVEVEFREKIACPDIIPWWMSLVTQNVTVTIENLPPTWKPNVTTSHPGKDELKESATEENRWEFTGIMLPGQGIEIQIQQREMGQS